MLLFIQKISLLTYQQALINHRNSNILLVAKTIIFWYLTLYMVIWCYSLVNAGKQLNNKLLLFSLLNNTKIFIFKKIYKTTCLNKILHGILIFEIDQFKIILDETKKAAPLLIFLPISKRVYRERKIEREEMNIFVDSSLSDSNLYGAIWNH